MDYGCIKVSSDVAVNISASRFLQWVEGRSGWAGDTPRVVVVRWGEGGGGLSCTSQFSRKC